MPNFSFTNEQLDSMGRKIFENTDSEFLRKGLDPTGEGDFMIWLAGSRGFKLDEILKICENPNRELNAFQKSINSGTNPTAAKQSILPAQDYAEAMNTLKNYRLPEVDYTDPEGMKKACKELKVVNTIIDCMWRNGIGGAAKLKTAFSGIYDTIKKAYSFPADVEDGKTVIIDSEKAVRRRYALEGLGGKTINEAAALLMRRGARYGVDDNKTAEAGKVEDVIFREQSARPADEKVNQKAQGKITKDHFIEYMTMGQRSATAGRMKEADPEIADHTVSDEEVRQVEDSLDTLEKQELRKRQAEIKKQVDFAEKKKKNEAALERRKIQDAEKLAAEMKKKAEALKKLEEKKAKEQLRKAKEQALERNQEVLESVLDGSAARKAAMPEIKLPEDSTAKTESDRLVLMDALRESAEEDVKRQEEQRALKEKIRAVKATLPRVKKELPKSFESYRILHTGYFVIDEPVEKMQDSLARVLAANVVQNSKESFNVDKIHKMADKIKDTLCIWAMDKEDLETALMDPAKSVEFAVEQERKLYGIPAANRDNYKIHMGMLKKSIDMTVEEFPRAVTPDYQAFVNAVNRAYRLDPKKAKDKDYIQANIEIENAAVKYMRGKGRMKVFGGVDASERVQNDMDRFNSCLDAMSLIHRDSETDVVSDVRLRGMLRDINIARGVEHNINTPKHLDIQNVGINHLSRRYGITRKKYLAEMKKKAEEAVKSKETDPKKVATAAKKPK